MNARHVELTTLKFEGPDFADHGIEIDALPDLVAYKALIKTIAEATWRSNNPRRQRLPKGFFEGIRLKFFALEPGSVGVAIKREVHAPRNGQEDFVAGSEVDAAAVAIEEAIESVTTAGLLPPAFPITAIPLFDGFGKSLRRGNRILLTSRQRGRPTPYTPEIRQKFIQWDNTFYEDEIELAGEVRQADLDGLSFTLRLDDDHKVTGKFEPEHETVLIEALRDHASRRVRVTGRARFRKPDGALDRLSRVNSVAFVPPGDNEYDHSVEPFWERLARLGEGVPDSDWRKVPNDLAERLDHYLYGQE